MKNLFISFFTLGASLVLNAQDKLMVNYESRMEVDADTMMKQLSANSTSNVDVKQFEKVILESMTRPTYYHLRIDQNESVFQQEERIQNEQPKEPNGHSGRISRFLEKSLRKDEGNASRRRGQRLINSFNSQL